MSRPVNPVVFDPVRKLSSYLWIIAQGLLTSCRKIAP